MHTPFREGPHPLDSGGTRKEYRFPNGYGASVIRSAYSYGGADGLWELAVLQRQGDEYVLTYETPITVDVIGWQTEAKIEALLDDIAALPPRTDPMPRRSDLIPADLIAAARAAGACADAVAWLKESPRTWGDLLTHPDGRQWLPWAVVHVPSVGAALPALAEVWRMYEAAIAEAWHAYHAAIAEARHAYHAAIAAEPQRAYHVATVQAQRAFEAAAAQAWHAYDVATVAAFPED